MLPAINTSVSTKMIDVFGGALSSFWRGDTDTLMTVRRDDDFTDTHSPCIWFSEDAWATSERPLMDHARGVMLDVGCGAGRHLLHFQNAGFDITGLDESPLAIDVCRKRGCEKLIAESIFEVSLADGSFDTILLFGNDIGIGGSPARTVTMLKRLRSALRRGGRILVPSLDVSVTENPIHQAYHEANRAAHKRIGQITIRLEYGDEIGEWFEWFHPSPDELEQLADEAGLRVSEMMNFEAGLYGAVLESPTG